MSTTGTLDSRHLANDAVTVNELANGALANTAAGRAKMADGFLSADAAGRAKLADGFFDEATVDLKFDAASIDTDRLKEGADLFKRDGSVTATGPFSMGSNKITGLDDGTSAGDAVNKSQLDAAVAGLTWKEPVSVFQMIGERTIAQINALTPAAGDSVVASDAGTPSAGTSDALVAGDIAEFDGTSWIKIVDQVSGAVPAGVRVVLSTTQALQSPFTDATDDGKVVVSVADPGTFDGAVSDWNDEDDSDDGDAILINGRTGDAAQSVNENKAYTFQGAVPTGSWTQFTGTIPSHTHTASEITDLDNVGSGNPNTTSGASKVGTDASAIGANAGTTDTVQGVLEALSSAITSAGGTPQHDTYTGEAQSGDAALNGGGNILTATPADATKVQGFMDMAHLAYATHFTVSGQSVTWLGASSGLALLAADTLHFYYES